MTRILVTVVDGGLLLALTALCLYGLATAPALEDAVLLTAIWVITLAVGWRIALGVSP